MTLRKGHGKGAGVPRVEVLPVDELPAPVPAPLAQDGRRANGTIKDPETARRIGRMGGLASARRDPLRAAKSMGLGQLISQFEKDARIEPFVTESERWMRQTLEGLARDVGGGELSAEVVSIVQTAAWERAFSRYLFDISTRSQFAWTVAENKVPIGDKKHTVKPNTETILTASRLGDSSRQNLLAAFELAAREAQARKAARDREPYDLGAALQLGDGKEQKGKGS